MIISGVLWEMICTSPFMNTSAATSAAEVYRHFLKLLSLTCKVLTTAQPSYLHNLISVQPPPPDRTCSSIFIHHHYHPTTLILLSQNHRSLFPICITLSLEYNLPASFRQPHPDHSPSDCSHSTHLGLPAASPPLSPSITTTFFHAELKANLFQKSFHHRSSSTHQTAHRTSAGLPSRTLYCSTVFLVLVSPLSLFVFACVGLN